MRDPQGPLPRANEHGRRWRVYSETQSPGVSLVIPSIPMQAVIVPICGPGHPPLTWIDPTAEEVMRHVG